MSEHLLAGFFRLRQRLLHFRHNLFTRLPRLYTFRTHLFPFSSPEPRLAGQLHVRFLGKSLSGSSVLDDNSDSAEKLDRQSLFRTFDHNSNFHSLLRLYHFLLVPDLPGRSLFPQFSLYPPFDFLPLEMVGE